MPTVLIVVDLIFSKLFELAKIRMELHVHIIMINVDIFISSGYLLLILNIFCLIIHILTIV